MEIEKISILRAYIAMNHELKQYGDVPTTVDGLIFLRLKSWENNKHRCWEEFYNLSVCMLVVSWSSRSISGSWWNWSKTNRLNCPEFCYHLEWKIFSSSKPVRKQAKPILLLTFHFDLAKFFFNCSLTDPWIFLSLAALPLILLKWKENKKRRDEHIKDNDNK